MDILSTMPSNSYGYLSGTSMATPHVAGVAALAWGLAGGANYTEIRNAILSSVDPIASLSTSGPTPVATGGRLNAYGAVQAVGMSVAGSTPAAGAIVASQPTDFVVHFSHPYDAATVDAGDLTVNLNAATSRTLTDADTVTFHFAASPVTAQGVQTMRIAAGALAAAAGSGLPNPLIHAWTATFRYDALTLAVTSTSPAPGGLFTLPAPFTYNVTFNEAIDPASADDSDLWLSSGTAALLGVSADNQTVHYRIDNVFDPGTLTVNLAAGAVTDVYGNPGAAFAADYTVIPGLTVAGSTPADGAIVATRPASYVIDFSDPVNPGSVDAGDFTVTSNGITLAATGVTLNGTNTQATFTFAVNPVTIEGAQDMAIAAEAITRVSDGDGIAAFSATFRWDTLTLAVSSTNHDPSGSLISLTGPVAYDVTFNEPVAAGSVDPSDLTLSQGTVTSAVRDALNPALVHYIIDGLTTEGTLDVSIAVGALTDVYGNPGFAGFAASYILDIDTVAFPTPLTAKAPLGSLIYDPVASGIIGVGSDTDSFTLSVAAGQTITVVVDPAATLQPTVALSGPLSPIPSPVTASAVGKDAVLQTVATTTSGLYTITVGSAGGTTGSYIVQVFLNAAVELESHDGPSTVQDISASFTPLLKGATRGAVLGQTDATMPTVTVISANFDSTADGFVVANGKTGLWHLSTGRGTQAGHTPTRSFYFGKQETASGGGNYSGGSRSGTLTSPTVVLPSGKLTVDFNYVLQTQYSTTLDLAQLQIKPTTSSTWTTLASYNGVAESSVWRAANPVDISSYGGQSVQLRFNFNTVNSKLNNFEGWYVDDVRISRTIAHDNYSFTVAAGQRVTVALNSLTGGDVNVQLQDAAGATTYATGAAGPSNVSKVIYNVALPSAGAYNLAITGATNTSYSLVVTRAAVFNVEGNDTFATAQDMTGTQGGLGHVTAGSNLFDLRGTPVSGGLVLSSSKLTLGINPDGSFINGSIGIQFLGNEFVVPGTPLAGFTIGLDGFTFSNHGSQGTTEISVTMEDLSAGSFRGVRIVGTVGGVLQLERVVVFNDGDEFATIASRLTNLSASTVTNVAWLENMDPDQGQPLGVGFETANDVVLGGEFVRADAKPVGFPGGLTIGLGSADPRRVVSAEGFDNRDPFAIIGSPVDPNGASADIGINLAFDFGNLGAFQAIAGSMIMAFGRTTAEAEATYLAHTGGTLVLDEDWYKITLGPTQTTLNLVTSTPGDGGGEPGNTLDPHIELYNSANVLIYSGTELADGRNEVINAIGLTPGATYRILIKAEAGTSGEYFLDPPLEETATLEAAPSVIHSLRSVATGREALAFVPPSAVFAGATRVAAQGSGTATPVVLSTVSAAAPPAAIRERVGEHRESAADAGPTQVWQLPVSAVPPAELGVPPTAPADEGDESGDPAEVWQSLGCDAVFADANWLSTLPTAMVTAPPAGADIAEPAVDLAAALAAVAFLINTRRGTAEARKKARSPIMAARTQPWVNGLPNDEPHDA